MPQTAYYEKYFSDAEVTINIERENKLKKRNELELISFFFFSFLVGNVTGIDIIFHCLVIKSDVLTLQRKRKIYIYISLVSVTPCT